MKVSKPISMESSICERLINMAKVKGVNPSKLAARFIEEGLNKTEGIFKINCTCGTVWNSNLSQCPNSSCNMTILKAVCQKLDVRNGG